MSTAEKWVYLFGGSQTDGNRKMKPLLGGKGANLAEMSLMGLPVPPGFTVSTQACAWYSDNEKEWPLGLLAQIMTGIRHIEDAMGTKFGDPSKPLLVSVRSGAEMSMPGMMDTVLNLGINDQVVEGLASLTNNERFAFDSYRRFIDMFGDVVMGVSHEHFENSMEALIKELGVKSEAEFSANDLRELVDRYKAVYRHHTGFMFPEDPYEQLRFTVDAVFNSWQSSRAIKYRQINKIRGLLGTAVNVQAMVYGNMGDRSATGVCFTRNPSTGEPKLYGEYLINAQGEDVVAGIRTPEPIEKLEAVMPTDFSELLRLANKLEAHYMNMQDIEFTIQEGTLYILQTRSGKRTGQAAIRIAVDLVDEGVVSKEIAVRDLVDPQHLDQLLHKQFADQDSIESDRIGVGLPASPGAAVGTVVFDADHAEKAAERGESVILVRVETSPEDVGGMAAAQGILTSRGGMTSHAAVVARGWGKPCVAGCGDIIINYKNKSLTNGKITIREGEWMSIDGTTGLVVKGKKELTDPVFDDKYYTFMKWVDSIRSMKVRANADTPEDAKKALEFGAEGIGLTRTEHMFFGDGRITPIREMIIAETQAERRTALTKLLPFQRDDFVGIFREMNGLPVTVRLLDPPLHEFLPHDDSEIIHVAHDLNIPAKTLKHKVQNLKEFNPMLGHRGCRLGITYPEITEMQTRAILEAALICKTEGIVVIPEIMVPLIGVVEEFLDQKSIIMRTAEAVFAENGDRIHFTVGTMIEVPRAALTASKIATEAEFFSFGTNDLTQTTFAFSRDDAGKFLTHYVSEKILPDDPFQVLDAEGVGRLITIATTEGRAARPTLKVGICGEHGGDPQSIAFFYANGLDYVSCSPFRLPLARLSLAQEQLKRPRIEKQSTALIEVPVS